MTAIGGLSEPVTVAFAGDGTAFIGLKTGVIKSFDYNAASDSFEPFATSTEFADLSGPVNNYGDRGLTGIAVDPQFPARPYVYVNYTYNRDPRDNPPVVPKWGTPGEQYDQCPGRGRPRAAGGDRLPGDGPGLPAHRAADAARLADGARQPSRRW